MTIVKRVELFWKIVEKIFYWLSVLCLGGMTFLIFLQVIFRYVFKLPLAWTEELSRFLFIWMTFTAGVVAAKQGQHIGVGLIVEMMPSIGRRVAGIFGNAVSAVFFGIVSNYCIIQWGRLDSQRSPALLLPMSYVYLGIILGSVFMGLYYLWSAIALSLLKNEEGT